MAKDASADRNRCVMSGQLFCYDAWYGERQVFLATLLPRISHFKKLFNSDCNNPLLCGKAAQDCLCIRHSCCCAVNTPHKGCGFTTDKSRGECCKFGIFCCDLGLIWPTKLCGSAGQVLCYYGVSNFPCSEEYIPVLVCTIPFVPFLQICPTCGCCVAPPPCPALDKVLRDEPVALVMQRT